MPIAVGVCEKQGRRPSMEDAIANVPRLRVCELDTSEVLKSLLLSEDKAKEVDKKAEENECELEFYAVFDGHGGKESARFSARTIPYLLAQKEGRFENTGESMIEAYLENDDVLRNYLQSHFPDSQEYNSGSTATSVCLEFDSSSKLYKRITCANSGDSRCVLIKRDGSAVALSVDHNVGNKAECKRIEEAGGFISKTEYGASKPRVLGALAVTRAIGDFDFKMPKVEAWGTRANPISTDLVLATPEIISVNCNDDDLALIIACDGIWDVYSNADAATFVKDTLKKVSRTNKEATADEKCRLVASKLIDSAINLGSNDNCSCAIVLLSPLALQSSKTCIIS